MLAFILFQTMRFFRHADMKASLIFQQRCFEFFKKQNLKIKTYKIKQFSNKPPCNDFFNSSRLTNEKLVLSKHVISVNETPTKTWTIS